MFVEITDEIIFRKQNHCLPVDFYKVFFLSNLEKQTNSEIKNATDGLQKAYPEDLESYIYEELFQFSCLLNEKCSEINVAAGEIFGCINL